MAVNSSSFLRQENARLKQENKELTEELQSLREFVTILTTLSESASRFKDDSELLPFLKDILIKALSLLNAPDGSLAIIDDETGELVFVIVEGALEEQLTNFRIPAGEGIGGWVIERRETALVRDVRRDQRFSHMIDDAFKFRTQSILATPIIGNQKCYGVIEILNQPGDVPFSENDAALLKLLSWAAGEALADMERVGAAS